MMHNTSLRHTTARLALHNCLVGDYGVCSWYLLVHVMSVVSQKRDVLM